MTTKIYTKMGDQGQTDNGHGIRVDKDEPLIEALGSLDELNSVMSLIVTINEIPEQLKTLLLNRQKEIRVLMSDIAQSTQTISEQHIQYLNQFIDQLDKNLPALKSFLNLETENHASACCHLARTICRRAERRLVSLSKQTEINPMVLAYINRLSDLLFMIARSLTEDLYNNR